tara:strand:+ start:10 stop:321 length:312 start_codon:yes stop_codon:yes gene_type:complete
LNIKAKDINWTKKSGILIIGICLIGLFIKYAVEPFRGTWIYSLGNWLFLILFYGGILWSIINTIQLIAKHKFDFKDNLIWIFLSAIPFLYIAIMITISMTKSI